MGARGLTRLTGMMVLGGLLAWTTPAGAQIDTASIVGTVTDQSGAVLPGVTVTATQEATGVASSTVTNGQGQYVFSGVRVGTYTVVAELSGFKKSERTGVRVSVQDRAQIDLQLTVGEVSEVVSVSGRSEILQTQSADIGNVVDEKQVQSLPLLGRRYSELAFLTPGVVVAPAGITSRGEDTFFNANGNYATWNNYTLDGADNNSFSTNLQERSPQVVQPPIDALAEFKVQTRTYSAEFGKSAGAVINASVKSGTNQFRGSLFEFFRDEAFNANTWDNNRTGRPKGKFNQHIAGFTFGGPVLRNRTFFFGDYQATRTDRALTQTATVPSSRMRRGDLSELTGNGVAGNAFVPAGCWNAATKQVSPNCIDPVAAKMMAYYPLPNIGGDVYTGAANFISNGILKNDINQFDVRVDHTLTSKDRIFGRYSFQDLNRSEPPVLEDPVASGDFSSVYDITGQNFTGGWSRVFGTAIFSEFRFGYNRASSATVHPAFGIDANSAVGLKGVPIDERFYGGLPNTSISRLTRLGGPFFRPQFQTSQVFQFSENMTWTKGEHTLKFGVERRRDLVKYIDLRSLNGELSFNDGRYTGFGISDFLLGLATSQRLTLFHEPDLYADGWQFYAQDNWRATPALTLTYGIRYERFTPLFDRNGKLTNIIPATGEIVTAKTDGSVYERALINPDTNDIAPRVGIIWRPSEKVVVRGGYGIFYQQADRYGSESQLGLNLPQLVDASITSPSAGVAPAFTFGQGFTPLNAATINKSIVQWRIQDPDQDTPIVQQFSIGPEWQFAPNMVGAIEYVGNRTKNGRRIRNLNQGQITTVNGVLTNVFPYAQYGYGTAFLQQIVTNGNADYDSLQIRAQRRFVNGWGFTFAYTWSKAMGDFLDHLSAGGGAGGNTPGNAYNMEADYGPLPFDVPHRIVTSFTVESPVGVDRPFNPGGVAGALLGGWVVNGIMNFDSGLPFTISANDQSGSGSGRSSRANCIGDPLPDGFEQTTSKWFDTSAFAQPGALTYGNCGYNTMRGSRSKSANMSIFRNIRLPNERRIELRAEVFNLFNWVNWGFPGSSVANAATFGVITSTRGDERQMQVAIKFYF